MSFASYADRSSKFHPISLMNIPLVTLCVVFVLIVVRQIGSVRIEIWQAMLLGAIVVLVSGSISPSDAVAAIDFDVMLFLFGMFVVGRALEESGYLTHLSYNYFKRAHKRDSLLLMIILGAGFFSALLMNDTLAIVGTPVVLLLARKHEMSPKLLLLALAFSITIGSVMSPIGNPQNLLIAVHSDVANPFVTFLRHLFLPTLINLLLAFWYLRWRFSDDFHDRSLAHSQEPIHSKELAFLSRISLGIIVLLVGAKIVLAAIGVGHQLTLTSIALAAALPIIVGSSDRWEILKKIDWHTLVFFAAMFVLMESVWSTGFFQGLIERSGVPIASTEAIMMISVVISQFISNVPLVALYQPLIADSASTIQLMALAAGSTIAGNLLILGAASNVIIVQNAERKGGETITFLEFAKVGIPLTLMNLIVYWIFLKL